MWSSISNFDIKIKQKGLTIVHYEVVHDVVNMGGHTVILVQCRCTTYNAFTYILYMCSECGRVLHVTCTVNIHTVRIHTVHEHYVHSTHVSI